ASRWALDPRRGGGAPADRAGRPVLALGAVGGAQALEAVPLHHAGGALALAPPGHIDQVTRAERLGGDFLPERVLVSVVGAQLDQVAAGGGPPPWGGGPPPPWAPPPGRLSPSPPARGGPAPPPRGGARARRTGA